MTTTIKFTPEDVTNIAKLANIPIADEEKTKLAEGFTTTMGVVNQLFTVDTQGVEPTHQVTGLENVFREDIVEKDRMLSQDDALSNAPRTHNGYFVVEQVIEKEG